MGKNGTKKDEIDQDTAEKRMKLLTDAVNFTEKFTELVQKGEIDPEVLDSYIKIMASYNKQSSTKERNKAHDKIRNLLAENQPLLWARFEELCVPCTPSYCFLPLSCGASNTEEADPTRVLNTRCKIVVRKDSPLRVHSVFKKFMFNFEDHRYELDMCLAWVRSALRGLELILKESEVGSLKTGPIKVEAHLTPMNLRCIKNLYDDRFETVLELMRSSPGMIMPRIISRLEGKEKELVHILNNVVVITK